jgi:ABC-type bacteriocin/lantibiotic exporter with double-glycine peptidase domain
VRRSFGLFSEREKWRIFFVSVSQVILAVLDLLAVGIVGILAALSVTGVQSSRPGNRVSTALNVLHLDGYSFQHQIAILGVIAALLLIVKTLVSGFLTKNILIFLSNCGATVSTNLIAGLFAQPLRKIEERTLQENLYFSTVGVSAIVNGIVGSAINLVTDISLMIILSAGLFLVDPVLAVASILIFSIIGIGMYLLQHKKAHALGSQYATKSITGNEKFLEALASFRETFVRNTQENYLKIIRANRYELGKIDAELTFLPNVGKYVIEIATVLAAIILCALQFSMEDATHAIATLSVFLAAGARIAPAVLRIQNSMLRMKSSAGAAIPALEMIEDFRQPDSTYFSVQQILDIEHLNFNQEVLIEEVHFKYDNNTDDTLNGISLQISPGETVAFVGPSGAGKSTLVDLMLGIAKPSQGQIRISGCSPEEAVKKWPGAIGYVPQEIYIKDGSILENVTMGYEIDQTMYPLINKSLEVAHLLEFVENLPEGLNAYVGEKGSRLSGGQRQRLGIARALFTSPGILVLDEATSSLDGQSEAEISDSISDLKGKVAVVIIAHRLSTIRNVEKIYYLDKGKILASGTFEEIRRAIPDFNTQANLMGL